ncbi:acyl-CoA dehydrogenase family protein [Oryzobacter telluris]|uniref:acyl-CoA dehydrogenase family protein n=1 Tax=Oryzobacter telluris TaxID=3149179 RepID=UPI00370D455C
MRLSLSTDQTDIIGGARDFLAGTFTADRRRELAGREGRSIDDATWAQVCSQGWLGVGLPTEVGGLGLGVMEEALLFREVGRHVVPGPLVGGVVGARIAVLSGGLDLAADIVSGHTRVGVCAGTFVVDAHDGDLAVRFGDGDAVELVSVAGVEPREAVDPGTRIGVASSLTPLHRLDDGSHVTAVARVLAAAAHLGVIEAVRDMSAAYAVTREQFGRPIGSFQAVKHRCADMAIAAYACRAQVLMAARCVDATTGEAALQAACARVVSAKYARRSAADNVQNLGGIGFTWEHDAHLYVKRAHTLDHLAGTVEQSHPHVLAGTPA